MHVKNKLIKSNLITRKHLQSFALLLPAILVIVVFVVSPVIGAVVLSLHPESGSIWSLQNYIQIFQNEIYQEDVIYTLVIVFWTVVLTIIISIFISLYLRFKKNLGTKTMMKVILLPKFIPGVIAVYAFMAIIKNGGTVTRISDELTGNRYMPEILHTMQGIIGMNLWFNIPIATLFLATALSKVKESYISAAKDIGMRNWLIFAKIIFPMIKRHILLAITFVFISNIGAFTTPFLMGENRLKMLGVVLFEEFSIYQNYSLSAALSVVMFLLSVGVGALYISTMMKDKDF